jgi:HK97 family phage major capsid protein
MWSSLPAPCRKRATWVVNEDVDLQLSSLATAIGTAGAISPDVLKMYVAAGAAGNETPLLKEMSIVVAEQCPALGTSGDIVLADMSQYFLNDGGPQTAISMHVQWLNFQAVFRFTQRVDGKPAWAAPITPANGTATRSPFVALAARS